MMQSYYHDDALTIPPMEVALRLAHTGEGATFPNPSVGAVIMMNDRLVASARTENGGVPHAETEAIESAQNQGINLQNDCTLFVTLEPCAHHGKTPPCVDAIIKSGLKTVIVGILDPDDRVSGVGIKALKQAGIEVKFQDLNGALHRFYQGYLRLKSKNCLLSQ